MSTFKMICVASLVFGCSSSTTVIHSEIDGAAGASSAGASGSGGNAGGTAGTEADGQAGASGSAGAAGGSGGSGPCVPKTCLTYAVEHGGTDACGIVDDSCGNVIDCGGCDNGQKCGGLPPPNPDKTPVNSDANTCAGGCTSISNTTDIQLKCEGANFNTKLFYCTNQIVPTSTNQTCSPSVWNNDGNYYLYCCY